MNNNEFLVLGAGIQGICIALELAKQGKYVTIIDQDTIPFNRASLRNEGKVHLGIVYMNDPTFATPKLMLKASMEFRKSLERWIGDKSYHLGLSNPFYYLVAKDSFLNPEELEMRYQKMEEIFNDYTSKHADWDYLGTKPSYLTKRVSDEKANELFGDEVVQAAFETAEYSVDTELLKKYLTEALLSNPRISFCPNHHIKNISRNNEMLTVSGFVGNKEFRFEAEQVINATWEGKFALDESFGVAKPKDLLHRLKYRVMVKIDPSLLERPSATMVIGKYGDVVIKKDGTAYLSWYPAGCLGWSTEISPPETWNEVSRGIVSEEKANALSSIFLEEIEKWFPGINKSITYLVDGAPIVAYGKTDVDDSNSKLHDRTNIGLRTYGGNYHSIDTGKLTTAPMFAVESVKSILNCVYS
ncbi:FAD-dependent oxidoreductase [Algoriphagus yeomjeoni]|uniref:FAD-dependent oxidoreductase n=1 Tax=Algoriphagus yeomjeoni TaxID=291403 RepID=UPI003CE5409E